MKLLNKSSINIVIAFFIFNNTPLTGQKNANKELVDTIGSARFFTDPPDTCSADNLCIELTSKSVNLAGAAWYRDTISLKEGITFSFCLNFGLDTNNTNGEGITIVIKGYSDTTKLGGGGDSLGYIGISPSLAIEFDTDYDPAFGDINSDHITLIQNGDPQTPLTNSIPLLPVNSTTGGSNQNIEDGLLHAVKLTWDSENEYFQVFIDDRLRLNHQVDLIHDVFNGQDSIIIGAMATTGDFPNQQYICMKLEPANFNTQQIGCMSYDTSTIFVDFDYWYQNGNVDNGAYETDQNGAFVKQYLDSLGATLLLSPMDFMNVEIDLSIEITDTTKGAIGFVFGHQTPFGSNPHNYDTWLFDKRFGGNSLGCTQTNPADYRISRIQGILPEGCGPNKDLSYFLGNQSSSDFKVLDKRAGSANNKLVYDFKLIYKPTEVTILEKRGAAFKTLFTIQDTCFKSGRFGFYSIDQVIDKYSFGYNFLADIELINDDNCEGFVDFAINLDTLCWRQDSLEYIDSIAWIFEDLINPTIVTNILPKDLFISQEYLFAENYQVSIRMINEHGCAGTDTINLTVHPLPKINLGEDITLCDGDSIFLDAGIENDSCVWNTGATTKTLTVDTAGIFKVMAYLGFCKSEDEIQISLNDAIVYIDKEIDASCSDELGGSITFDIQGGTIPYTYYLNGTAYLDSTIDSLAIGNYTFQVIDAVGCDIIIYETIASLNNIDEEILEVQAISCYGQKDGNIEVLSIDSESWIFSLDGINYRFHPAFDSLSRGQYTLYVQDTFNCTSLLDFEIIEPGELYVDLGADITISLGDTSQLNPASNSTTLLYKWQPTPGISCMDCAYPFIYPIQSSQYKLMVTSAQGCIAEDEINISVDKNYDVYFPNVFSPNGDGINDYFMPYENVGSRKIRSFEFIQIYDRWGNFVFEKRNFLPNDFNAAWDGNFNQKPANQGAYIYHGYLNYIDGHKESFTGTITLLR